MIPVKLVDGSFVQSYSFGYAGENILAKPLYIEWDRTPGPAPVTVFTDSKLREAGRHGPGKKVALLIESPAIRRGVYEQIVELAPTFDVVLTFNMDLVEQGDPFRFYPLGGSWIPMRRWGMGNKTRLVSLLTSSKTGQEGHRLRHAIALRWPDMVDVYGADYGGYVKSKIPTLEPYRYSVIIENTKHRSYFTEKLIDALCLGTVPIYWGTPDSGEFFDPDGIIQFDDLLDFEKVLGYIGPRDYTTRIVSIRRNLNTAREYRCPEDWLWRHYPGVFDASH